MKTSDHGVRFIQRFEGLRLGAYQCSAGVWTIGYGHTLGVKRGDAITEAQADALLREDLEPCERAVNDLVTVQLSQGAFDSLVSFVFNLGRGAFSSSTLLKLLNKGDYQGAADQFEKWCRAGGRVLPGLLKRRHAEAAMFLGEA